MKNHHNTIATIEKIKVGVHSTMKVRVKKIQQEYVDAWNVDGYIDGMMCGVQTRDYNRALEYKRLIDTQDKAGFNALFERFKDASYR